MLLRGYNSQRAINDRFPMPVDVTADTSKLTTITGEIVQLQYFENAYLTCGATGTTNAATWAALTDTSTFEITLNGNTYRITPDFTGDASMANVASSIQTALDARVTGATCVYSTDRFVITTASEAGVGNSISYLTNSSANTGTDITTATWINGIDGNAIITNAYLANDTGEAAGTVVVGKLLYDGVLDSLGAMIGNEKETSLVWTTNTVLPKAQIKMCPKSVIEDITNVSLQDIVEDITKDFDNGDWCLEHRHGIIIGKKATVGTTDTATYKIQTSETSGGGGLTGDVDIKKVGGVDVSAKDAAYAEHPLGMGLEYEALGSLTTDGSAAGDKVPVKGTATGIQYVIHTNGTQSMPTMDANTRSGYQQITDGTNEVDIIATINSLKSDVSSVGGEAVVADNGAGAGVTKTIPIGGKYNAVAPTYTDGDVAMVQLDNNGNLKTVSMGVSVYENASYAETEDEANKSEFVSSGLYGLDTEGSANSKLRAVQVATDNAGLSATPNVLVNGGIYKNTLDTYDDNDAVPLHFDVNGRLLTDANVTIEGIDYTDDSNEFTVATSKGISIMGVATSDSVDANDIGAVRMTTARNLGTDMSTIAGTATNVNGGNRDAGTQTITLADDDPAVASLTDIETNTDFGAVVDGGAEATALRVTIANDSTGLVSVDDNGGSLTVDTTGTAGLEVIQDTASDLNCTEANSGDIKTAVEVMDDWDENDRAKVNLIVGQDGVSANTGTADATTQRVTIATDDALVSANATPTTLTGGEKTVAASGTAEALGASLATKNIYIRAKKTNTGDVYVGDVNVDAVTSQQIVLSSGEAVTLSISNRATVYLDVDTNGEGVDYVCMS